MDKINELVEDFSALEEVDAIVLGGSRASGLFDENSDYNLYVYWNHEIEREKRKQILEYYCSYLEIDNRYWETEDYGKLRTGSLVEIIYRRLEVVDAKLYDVVFRYQAQSGYTTYMWDNLKKCQILYDKNGDFQRLKDKYNIPYPDALRDSIIDKNIQLLRGSIPSFSFQLEKAFDRDDPVSINHYVAEFMASYFDILFAYNRQTNPGKKRLLAIAKNKCRELPEDFEKNVLLLLDRTNDKEAFMRVVGDIVQNMMELIV